MKRWEKPKKRGASSSFSKKNSSDIFGTTFGSGPSRASGGSTQMSDGKVDIFNPVQERSRIKTDVMNRSRRRQGPFEASDIAPNKNVIQRRFQWLKDRGHTSSALPERRCSLDG